MEDRPKFSEIMGIDPKEMLSWPFEFIHAFSKAFPELSKLLYEELAEMGRDTRGLR